MKDLTHMGVDFSRLEASMAQHLGGPLAENDRLINRMLDLHKVTAALLYGKKYGEVDGTLRQRAKAINFTHLYTPGNRWQVPEENQLMAIYTDLEKAELAKALGVALPNLYQAIKARFEQGYR